VFLVLFRWDLDHHGLHVNVAMGGVCACLTIFSRFDSSQVRKGKMSPTIPILSIVVEIVSC